MGRMPNLTKEEQRELGAKMSRVAEPLPRDQRLLLYIAGLYGECRSQGLNSAQLIDLVIRTVKVHDAGLVVLAQAQNALCCPTCGGAL